MAGINYKIMNSRYVIVGKFIYSEECGILRSVILSPVLLNKIGNGTPEAIKAWIRNRMSAGTFAEQMTEIDNSGGSCLTDEYFVFKDDLPSVIAFPYCQGVKVGDIAHILDKGFLYVDDTNFRIGKISHNEVLSLATSYTVISVSDRAVCVRCE